ncbi:hypothetical protein UFOVP41_36 [uncultured Caudovirales phage]|uniref:Uncharacterized protein n=1 Tax=uncultured Caudovirales phage TaxID=2100421 RepID=A0A6J5KPV2_9CAUD|nr:hypothetical protein UFOVP41_36 [uncultured Caudovirales phage]
MTTFEINIAISEDNKTSKNVFYQQFYDNGTHKAREIIRIINEFGPEPKPFEFKPPILMDLPVLNCLTDEAKHATNLSGKSINAELVHLINKWFMDKTL